MRQRAHDREPYRTAATARLHYGRQSRQVIALAGTGQLGMAAAGQGVRQIQLAVVTLMNGHGLRLALLIVMKVFGLVLRRQMTALVPSWCGLEQSSKELTERPIGRGGEGP